MKKPVLWFALALALQVLILASIPAQKAYTRATGRSVILKVAPVDPYSILSGYYVTLGYEISRPGALLADKVPANGATVYTVVEQNSDGIWQPVEVTTSLPQALPNNRVFLRGRYTGWQIEYGIENFYIPETQREAVAEDLQKHPDKARVEIKVDRGGNAALVRLIIEDRVYEN